MKESELGASQVFPGPRSWEVPIQKFQGSKPGGGGLGGASLEMDRCALRVVVASVWGVLAGDRKTGPPGAWPQKQQKLRGSKDPNGVSLETGGRAGHRDKKHN